MVADRSAPLSLFTWTSVFPQHEEVQAIARGGKQEQNKRKHTQNKNGPSAKRKDVLYQKERVFFSPCPFFSVLMDSQTAFFFVDAQHARGNESLVSLSFFDHHRKGSTIVSAVVVYPVSRTSIDSSSNSLSSVVVSLDDPKSSHTPPSSLTSFDLLAVSPTVIGSLRRRRAIVCYLVLYDGRRHPPRSLVCQMEWSGVEWSGACFRKGARSIIDSEAHRRRAAEVAGFAWTE